MATIRIAVLGSGIFAREAHAPAFGALEDRFEIVAIFSRSIENAAALAATFKLRVRVSKWTKLASLSRSPGRVTSP